MTVLEQLLGLWVKGRTVSTEPAPLRRVVALGRVGARNAHSAWRSSRQRFFRDDLLRDRVALITGGGSGICKGIALAYAQHGARTVLVGRTQTKLDAAAAEIAAQGGAPSLGYAADVRDFDAVAAVVARTVEEVGPIDILVNGAAGNFLAPAAQLSSNGFRTVLDIDAVGTFNVSRAVFCLPAASSVAASL